MLSLCPSQKLEQTRQKGRKQASAAKKPEVRGEESLWDPHKGSLSENSVGGKRVTRDRLPAHFGGGQS